MEATQSVIELVADAQAKAKASEQRVAEIETLIAQQGASKDASEELNELLSGMEAAVVDIYSLFESRMQRNFKRGPFSRKLKALLMEAKNPDLADRIHQYYLAVNVFSMARAQVTVNWLLHQVRILSRSRLAAMASNLQA